MQLRATDSRGGEAGSARGTAPQTPLRAAQTPAESTAPRIVTADDKTEFARKFSEAFRTLWAIAAGIVNDRAIAEDVVQEAAVTALAKLDEFEPDSNFTAWMAKIVRYIALNQSRRGRRHPSSVDPAVMDDSMQSRALPINGQPALVDVLGRLDESRTPFDDRVMKALHSVGDVARACLLLRTLEDLSYEEIATVLEIPPGTAMSHVHRTRILLRERLADMNPVRAAISSQPAPQPAKDGGVP